MHQIVTKYPVNYCVKIPLRSLDVILYQVSTEQLDVTMYLIDTKQLSNILLVMCSWVSSSILFIKYQLDIIQYFIDMEQ